MAEVVRVHKLGGPEVLSVETAEVPPPGPGEARIRQTACGVNFIDTYFRTGLYPAPLPFIVGNEGAGVVEAVGEGVTDVAPGDRVAYVVTLGAYASERNAPADRLVKIPDGVSDEQAAGMMLKGMTARYLLRRTFRVQPGHTILVQAAAGGVGLILTQWAKHLGATVIGTVGSEEKAALARAHGCDHTILYRTEDFAARVKEITGGKGCEVVYDGVGKDTFPVSLDCLKPLGMFVSFGSASGPIDAFPLSLLLQKGSLFATRPTLNTYTASRADLVETASDLFDVVASGAVKIPVNQRYRLAEAAKAHRDLEGRATTGSAILVP